MGYDLHITRRENWFDEHGLSIDRGEWLKLVEADPTLRLDGHAQADLPDGATLRIDDPTMVVWTGWARDGVDGGHAWLWLNEDGTVVAKNPAQEIIVKMHAISLRLNARVQGDEGEFYGADGLPIPDLATKTFGGWLRRMLGQR